MSIMYRQELTLEDFESIDNKIEGRITCVRSHEGYDNTDLNSDDGSVQTGIAICQDSADQASHDGGPANAAADEEDNQSLA